MMGSRRCRCLSVATLALACVALPHAAARAQLGNIMQSTTSKNIQRDEPVTFSADSVEYDKDKALVTANGHVEAWQNGHVLRADKITFDRNTGVAAATGNVVLMEPDGEVIFADYAEMHNNMQDGILKDFRALLQENGRLAANGAQRTGGQINELSKIVYSVCNACSTDPSRPLLWQIRAASAVQDVEHKKIEYYDATLDMFGVPVAYMPYFWHPDPSVKRMSGLLPPVMGNSSHIGAYYGQPYYWVIDDQSDATFIPMITTQEGPQLSAEYRYRFNSGNLTVNGSVGHLDNSMQGSLAAKGEFSWDDTWRYGFTVNRASSANYVRDFHLLSGISGDPNVLTSQFYLEGFGEGAYARLDSRVYQAMNTSITSSQLPLVLPRFTYSYMGRPDSLGGRLSVDTGFFNVVRTDGTNTRRGALTVNWERPFVGRLGDLWKITLHGDAIGYNASQFEQQPSYGYTNNITTARALPQAALDFRWPFSRNSGDWGTQLIEPIAQVIVAPQTGDSQLTHYPNEDSLDFEFSDANLFGFNRFPGIDRLEGGPRANVAMHSAWYLGGTAFDGMIGQSYRTNKDNLFPVASGLHNQVSDIVARATFAPTQWMDVTYRTRLNPGPISTHAAEAVASVGVQAFRMWGGYVYTNFDPYYYYNTSAATNATEQYYTPRNEVSLGVSSQVGNYRFVGSMRRDLATNQMVYVGADAIYEDECFIFDLRFYRRYTSYNGDNGSTAVLFLMTFKTIGQFGYRAL